jgi:hypothetical protein
MSFPPLIELTLNLRTIIGTEDGDLNAKVATGRPLRRGPLPWGTVRWHSTYGAVIPAAFKRAVDMETPNER